MFRNGWSFKCSSYFCGKSLKLHQYICNQFLFTVLVWKKKWCDKLKRMNWTKKSLVSKRITYDEVSFLAKFKNREQRKNSPIPFPLSIPNAHYPTSKSNLISHPFLTDQSFFHCNYQNIIKPNTITYIWHINILTQSIDVIVF